MSEPTTDLTPDEEWLLLGFREAASKRSKKPLQDRFLNWVREEVDVLLRERNQNPEVVQLQTSDSFRQFLFRSYLCPVLGLVGTDPNWSEIGRRVGAHAVTVQNWLESNPNPKLSTLSMVYAAQNAEFRSGHKIAADGYIYAFDFLCRSLDRPTSSAQSLSLAAICEDADDPDSEFYFPAELREETLILYNVFRTAEFWQALEDGDDQALHRAANRIASQTDAYYPCTRTWDVKAIRELLRKRAYEWSVMEAALPYEWF